jgi:hypothetical protein
LLCCANIPQTLLPPASGLAPVEISLRARFVSSSRFLTSATRYVWPRLKKNPATRCELVRGFWAIGVDGLAVIRAEYPPQLPMPAPPPQLCLATGAAPGRRFLRGVAFSTQPRPRLTDVLVQPKGASRALLGIMTRRTTWGRSEREFSEKEKTLPEQG